MLTGVYSGVSAVATKYLVEVLRETTDMTAKIYGLIASISMLIISLILNLTTMNHLLSLYPSLKAVPTSQSMILIGTVMCGGILLDEFAAYTALKLLLFCLGVIICVVGLYLKIY